MAISKAELRAARAIKERRTRLTRTIIDLYHRREEPKDPLGANYLFYHLAAWKKEGDDGVSKIREATSRLIARTLEMNVSRFSLHDAKAAHRDLAMAVTASTLHGEHENPEAEEVVPRAKEALQKWKRRTGLSERDTDQLYVLELNSRRFTNDETIIIDEFGDEHSVYLEDMFKVSVREGLLAQTPFLKTALKISRMSPQDSDFAQTAVTAALDFSPMTAGIAGLPDKVFPNEWFTENLLPFLKGYKLDGVDTFHSGTQMVHVLAANLLLGFDIMDSSYPDFQAKNLEYATNKQRAVVLEIQRNVQKYGNLIDKVTLEGGVRIDPETASQQQLEAAAAVMELVLEIKKFRDTHGPIAQRSLNDRRYHEGSAGDSQMLKNLQDWTHAKIDLLQPYYDKCAA